MLKAAAIRARIAAHDWAPKTRLARLTAYFAALDLFFALLWALFTGFRFSESGFRGWVNFLSFLTAVFLTFLALRWIRKRLLWRLRNRLFVTYVFIGVIPVVLLVTLAALSTIFFAGQFATFVLNSSLQSELQRLDTLNARVTSDAASRLRGGSAVNQKSVDAVLSAGAQGTGARVTAWFDGKALLASAAAPPPAALAKPDFQSMRSFVFDGGTISLRAARTEDIDGKKLVVLSTIALDKALLERIASGLGQVTVAPFESGGEAPKRGVRTTPANKSGVSFQVGEQHLETRNMDTRPDTVRAGALPPAMGFFDREITAPGILDALNWSDNSKRSVFLLVQTRPSLLYERLFTTVGPSGRWLLNILLGIAVLFGLMELFALAIGLRMTKTITGSVHSLYAATEHVNRGDLTYRINVKRQDQLAALESSFNSMMGSLQRLLADQKEKQKLEHELAIGAEVQAQLFPHQVEDLRALEIFGVCRPARTVSGDYYDFLHFSPERVGIAVGDVSGKGISAALLMATIHSAVRAYTLETAPALATQSVGAAVLPGHSEVSPSSLMALLNRQLYRSTPAEKYATMFFGNFDGRSGRMTYCNAGHLCPLLLAPDGGLRRLDCGGTVVGLFDGVPYSEDEVRLAPGDLFIAFSDGVTEPENDFGEFGEERLLQLIAKHRHLPLNRIAEEVTAAVYDWIGGAEQPDDITLVLARAR